MANPPQKQAKQINDPRPVEHPEERYFDFFQKIRETAFTQLVGMKIAREGDIKEGKHDGNAVRDPRWGDLHDQLADTLERAIDHNFNRQLLGSTKDTISGYTSLFQAIGTVSALGAGFVFTVLFSDIKPSLGDSTEDASSVVNYIRGCLMVAWLLFVLSTLLSSIAVALIWIFRAKLARSLQYAYEEGWHKSFASTTIIVGLLVLTLIPLGAFLAVSLALRPYNNVIGIAGIGVIAAMGVGLAALSAWALWLRDRQSVYLVDKQ